MSNSYSEMISALSSGSLVIRKVDNVSNKNLRIESIVERYSVDEKGTVQVGYASRSGLIGDAPFSISVSVFAYVVGQEGENLNMSLVGEGGTWFEAYDNVMNHGLLFDDSDKFEMSRGTYNVFLKTAFKTLGLVEKELLK